MLSTKESKAVGKLVKDHRLKNNLIQSELAELVNMKIDDIWRIENGAMRYRNKPERIVLKPIADVFGIAVDDLLGGIQDRMAEDNKIVKELSEQIAELKRENKDLEKQVAVWKSRVSEMAEERQRIIPANEGKEFKALQAEIQRQKEHIDMLESKLANAEQKQGLNEYERIILKMAMEKYSI